VNAGWVGTLDFGSIGSGGRTVGAMMASTSIRRGATRNARANTALPKRRPWFFIAVPGALLVIATSIFSPTVALGGFDEGVANYRIGNYKDAFKEWTEAGHQGDADAQYNLGCLYVRGEGVSRNRDQAAEWFGVLLQEAKAERSIPSDICRAAQRWETDALDVCD
jgi:hypothetical protein